MRGLMQDWPLLCHKVIDHAATQHGDREVISRSVEGPIHRTNYARSRTRARVRPSGSSRTAFSLGDRAATLAWNTWRHLEVWYGLLGIGGDLPHRQSAALSRTRSPGSSTTPKTGCSSST